MEVINAIAELERLGIEFIPCGENEIKTRCPDPRHKDSDPSLYLNTEKNVFLCRSCGFKGDFITFLSVTLGKDRKLVTIELGKRYDIEEVKTFALSKVEEWHESIDSSGPLKKQLEYRGVTDEMIRYARIGYAKGRITIPIFDRSRRVINVRRYLPGAPGGQKMRNMPGMKATAIYQIEDLKYDKIIFCGGEIKALVTGFHSRQEEIGAISATGGEGVFLQEWIPLFKNKIIYVCMDIDAAGENAAKKISSMLLRVSKELYVIRLPLDKEKFPKGDISDFWATGGTLKSLLQCAEKFKIGPIETVEEPKEIISISLPEARNPKYTRRRVSFTGIVSAADKTPYIIPSKVQVSCERNQPNCHLCPVFAEEEVPTLGLSYTNEGILDIIGAPKSSIRKALPNALSIPPCRSAQFIIREYTNAYDIRMAPRLNLTEHRTEQITQPGFVVSKEIELNTPYKFEGILYPSPKDQQAVLVIDSANVTEDNLDTFEFDSLEDLKIFQPKSWTIEDVKSRLNSIYNDFEANVTRILCRREIHLAIDLTYHSPLYLRFDNRPVPGWVNCLILGDSSQGKSETSTQLKDHYMLGERVDCKNATVAGLLGGLQQLGNRWFVTWGVIPCNDRRLVILEEVKGAHPEVIAKLTDMRSSGIAEIPKIDRRKTAARTRLIWISNARSGRQIASYGFGTDAIRELIGGLEDIRRFDLALLVSESQVDPTRISQRVEAEHIYTSELCRKLILFSWTRKIDQILFEDGVEDFILSEAIKLCSEFSESLPLVDKGTTKYKLARLSAACAARTASFEERIKENGGKDAYLIVRKCHVEFIVEFLRKRYSDSTFGYKEYSDIESQSSRILDTKDVKRKITSQKYPQDFVEQLLRSNTISKEDVIDWVDIDDDAARSMISFFVRKHCLRRLKRGDYHKTPEFISLLKDMSIPENVPEIFEDEEL